MAPYGGPRRSTPDDRFFSASIALFEDAMTSDQDMRFAALAALPTPVAAQDCFRMWIPAPQLTTEKNIDEILISLAADSQPATWGSAHAHLRDFVRIPGKGVGFVCTSEATCHQLGGLTLTVCGYEVKIKKFSLFDKWYYVDLLRLPQDVSDQDIYEWFAQCGARPVLVAPTYAARHLQSRGRTVYFPQVACPEGLFDHDGKPIREIYFGTDEKPCFVNHRTIKYNKVTPPSLRKQKSKKKPVPADADDEDMGSDAGSQNSGSPAGAPDGNSSGQAPPAGDGSQKKSIIVPKLDVATTPQWRLVQHSQRGLLKPREYDPTAVEPIPCELEVNSTDATVLNFKIPVTANYYEVISTDYEDATMPANVDLVATVDDRPLVGVTTDTTLFPQQAGRVLKATRQFKFPAEHLSLAELDKLIAEYVEKDFRNTLNHDDVLATIQVQPGYLRSLFTLPTEDQVRIFTIHAAYRAMASVPLVENEPVDYVNRYAARGIELTADTCVQALERMFPDPAALALARNLAVFELYLMVTAPSIHADPLKVRCLLPDSLVLGQLASSPFLLWADIVLMCVARSDATTALLQDDRMPPVARDAITAVAAFQLPKPIPAGTTRVISPQL